MKNKVLPFAAGVATTLIAVIALNIFTHQTSIQYHYESAESRQKMIELLEEKSILYSYEIDHLKRHWIKPWVSDHNLLKSVELEFDNWKGGDEK